MALYRQLDGPAMVHQRGIRGATMACERVHPILAAGMGSETPHMRRRPMFDSSNGSDTRHDGPNYEILAGE